VARPGLPVRIGSEREGGHADQPDSAGLSFL
jgi:hypothetical protein